MSLNSLLSLGSNLSFKASVPLTQRNTKGRSPHSIRNYHLAEVLVDSRIESGVALFGTPHLCICSKQKETIALPERDSTNKAEIPETDIVESTN